MLLLARIGGRGEIVVAGSRASCRRWFATGTRGSRGHGWLEKYRRGDGGRHLQGPLWDRNVEELQDINNTVFGMGSQLGYIDMSVGSMKRKSTSGSTEEESADDDDDNDDDDDAASITRLQLELATEALPLTTQNFLRLCQDDYYTDTTVYRFERNVGLCLGDVSKMNGKGGHCHPSLSVNGQPHLPETEPLVLSHLPGIVTMISPGVDKVDSRFMLCVQEAPHLDGRFVPFARLDDESLAKARDWFDNIFVRKGVPIVEMKITGAGLLVPDDETKAA